MSTTTYDTVLYPSFTHSQTHPSRLAVVGTLMGLKPAPPANCRLLEIGCGDGTNLAPMAWAYPESKFVGVDLASKPIALGQEMVRALGLRNIDLHCADLLAIDESWGKFDYIIAHGLYSWVPLEVRNHLLALCRKLLNPHGLAFISYNALPGGHLRTMIREMMLFHVRGAEDPDQRVTQAKALVKFLSDGQNGPDEYRAWMKAELDRVLEHQPGYLFHDQLAAINKPLYFSQFVQHAAQHGLQYLAEADYFEMSAHGFNEEIRKTLEQLAGNRVLREQYLDFLKCRRFRQTLLCHHEVPLQPRPRPEQVLEFTVTSPARCVSNQVNLAPGVPSVFQAPNGARCETDYVLGKAALAVLSPLCPVHLTIDETLNRALKALSEAGVTLPQPSHPAKAASREELCDELAAFLLTIYGAGLVDFRTGLPQAAIELSDRPVAFPVARWEAGRRDFVTSLFHIAVKVEDEIGKHLLLWLDGTRDRDMLAQDLWNFLKSRDALVLKDGEEAARRELTSKLEENLNKLARLGLLVA